MGVESTNVCSRVHIITTSHIRFKLIGFQIKHKYKRREFTKEQNGMQFC